MQTTTTTTTVEYTDGGTTYMEQEDEWEREGLLDPAWEKQQKKVRGVIKSSLETRDSCLLSLILLENGLPYL